LYVAVHLQLLGGGRHLLAGDDFPTGPAPVAVRQQLHRQRADHRELVDGIGPDTA
jgi:hypothetical protein